MPKIVLTITKKNQLCRIYFYSTHSQWSSEDLRKSLFFDTSPFPQTRFHIHPSFHNSRKGHEAVFWPFILNSYLLYLTWFLLHTATGGLFLYISTAHPCFCSSYFPAHLWTCLNMSIFRYCLWRFLIVIIIKPPYNFSHHLHVSLFSPCFSARSLKIICPLVDAVCYFP